MLKLKLPGWLWISLIIIIGVLIFALGRGCNPFPPADPRVAILRDSLKQAHERIREDSIDYIMKDSVNDGQAEIERNRVQATERKLAVANDSITKLLAQYKPVTPKSDTELTPVSSEYIAWCAGCFKELDNGQKLVKLYKDQKDSLQSSLEKSITLKDWYIDKLQKSNASMNLLADQAVTAAENAAKKAEPRRTLYFSLSTIFWDNLLPKGVGGGFSYQDKMRRQFGLRTYFTNGRQITTAEIAFPLTLKRR